jgi:dTDP-4-amino-4,6-dideoxygalactose transaminase
MYDVPTLGLNYRMSDINAALGRVQLSRVRDILDLRRRNFAALKSELEGIDDCALIDADGSASENSHYCLSIILQGTLAEHRDLLIARLREAGIGTSIYYPQPVPRMTYYRDKYGYDPSRFPNATAISDASIALPVGPHLSEEDVGHIADTVKHCIRKLAP